MNLLEVTFQYFYLRTEIVPIAPKMVATPFPVFFEIEM